MEPEIRRLLVLSTAHLPALLWEPEPEGGVLWNTPHDLTEYGCLMWVPDDPQESAGEAEEEYAVHPACLAAQVYARARGCDYVLFDSDGPKMPDLPLYDPEDDEPTCGRCGGPGAAGAAGLCRSCVDEDETAHERAHAGISEPDDCDRGPSCPQWNEGGVSR